MDDASVQHSAGAFGEMGTASQSGAGATGGHVRLRFSPGCLLDAAPVSVADRGRASLSLTYRSGDERTKPAPYRGDVMNIPSSATLKPFVEWVPESAAAAAAAAAARTAAGS